MPLFEIGNDELIPVRRVQAGPELYEQEIEDLLWSNLDAFVGVQLFPVARQPALGDGLRPDIVALDSDGSVHVIEVKRDVDRSGEILSCPPYTSGPDILSKPERPRSILGLSRWTCGKVLLSSDDTAH